MSLYRSFSEMLTLKDAEVFHTQKVISMSVVFPHPPLPHLQMSHLHISLHFSYITNFVLWTWQLSLWCIFGCGYTSNTFYFYKAHLQDALITESVCFVFLDILQDDCVTESGLYLWAPIVPSLWLFWIVRVEMCFLISSFMFLICCDGNVLQVEVSNSVDTTLQCCF